MRVPVMSAWPDGAVGISGSFSLSQESVSEAPDNSPYLSSTVSVPRPAEIGQLTHDTHTHTASLHAANTRLHLSRTLVKVS